MKQLLSLLLFLILFSCKQQPSYPEGEWVYPIYNAETNKGFYEERILIKNGKIEAEWPDYGLDGREIIHNTYAIDSVVIDTTLRKFIICITKDKKGDYIPVIFVLLPDGSIRLDVIIGRGISKKEMDGWITNKEEFNMLKVGAASGKRFIPKKDFELYNTLAAPSDSNLTAEFYMRWFNGVESYLSQYPDSVRINMLMTNGEIASKLMCEKDINPYSGMYGLATIERRNLLEDVPNFMDRMEMLNQKMAKAYHFDGTCDIKNRAFLEWAMGIDRYKKK